LGVALENQDIWGKFSLKCAPTAVQYGVWEEQHPDKIGISVAFAINWTGVSTPVSAGPFYWFFGRLE